MSDFPRFGEAFEGYVERVNELLDEWTPFIKAVSGKIDAGTYDGDSASADFPRVAKLVADSLFGLGSEAIDALAILTSDFSEEEKVTYSVGAAKAGSTRTLALKGDLTSVTGQVLPKSRVKFKPSTLHSADSAFTLDVNGDGLKARTYDGYVVITTVASATSPADVDEMFVSVTIG